MNRLFSKCTGCGFKKIAAIVEEDLNYYLEKLGVKEKMHYHLFKDFDEKF